MTKPRPDALDAMRDLRAAAAVLEGVPNPPPAVARVLEGLGRYERNASAGLTLEQALGLAVGPGGKPWWRVEAKCQRDAELAALAREAFGDLDLSTAAREIARDARRYSASGWKADKDKALRDITDPKRRRLRRVLEAAEGRAIGERQVRNILKNQAGK